MGSIAEDGHRSGVLAHNLMCYGQSEARAAFLSREEGIEDPFRILLVDPASLVMNINIDAASTMVSFQ
jgi:hypothetical protein